ncbi:MAG TPA: hypothetical protein VFC63_14995 [Blastocatellia bacterium]|nr:hypothetical protein [Blastocatellia bacterium]
MNFLKKAVLSLGLSALSIVSIGALTSPTVKAQDRDDRWERHDRRVERRMERRWDRDDRWMRRHNYRMTGYYDGLGRFHPTGYYDRFGYFHPYY